MKKWSFVLLILCCKLSFAQKVNLPDSLTFTLEYIDSSTFANSKSLNAELVRDISDFKWSGDTLFLLNKNKLVIHYLIDSFVYNGPKITIVDSSHHISPIGYYKNADSKIYLFNLDDVMNGKIKMLYEPINNTESYIDELAVSSKSKKIFTTKTFDIGYIISTFSITENFMKVILEYDFNCVEFDSRLNCFQCLCFDFEECKWIDDSEILMRGHQLPDYSKLVYFRLTLKNKK